MRQHVSPSTGHDGLSTSSDAGQQPSQPLPSTLVSLVQRGAAAGDAAAATLVSGLAKQASFRVFDFSPRQLVQVIRGLAGLAHHRKDSLVDDDDADPGLVVPARLLDDGSRVLARAVAANALSAHDIVEVTWSYAALDSYPRDLFDASCRCLLGLAPLEVPENCMSCVDELGNPSDDAPCTVEDVSLSSLGPQDLYRLAWAYAVARSQDERYRRVRDVPLLNALALALQPTLITLPGTTLARLLAIFSSIPHYEPRLFSEAAAVLLQRQRRAAEQQGAAVGSSSAGIAPLSAEDALSAVRSFTRVEHRGAKPLLLSIMDWVLAEGLDRRLEPADLLDLASAMSVTGAMHAPLMRSIVVRADRTGALARLATAATATAAPPPATAPPAGAGAAAAAAAPALHPALTAMPLQGPPAARFAPLQLLDLARTIAAVQHLDPPFYEVALKSILQSVNQAHLEEDLGGLSDHCGSTTPDGIQK